MSKKAEVQNYGHPGSHPPAIITQDSLNRFVTDAQIAAWDSGGNAAASAAAALASEQAAALSEIAASDSEDASGASETAAGVSAGSAQSSASSAAGSVAAIAALLGAAIGNQVLTFGGGGSGDVASITITDGLVTAVTLVP